MLYGGFLFDFDYTLGDSTEGIVDCIHTSLSAMGHACPDVETIRRTIGLSLAKTYAVLTGDADTERAREFAVRFHRRADDVMVISTQLYADTLPVLTKLKEQGAQVGIVTTKSHARIEQILRRFHIENLVDVIIGAEDVRQEKPDPEGLLMARAKLDLPCQSILYTGDSLVDAQAAQRASIPFAAVLTGTTERESFSEYPAAYMAESLLDVYQFAARA